MKPKNRDVRPREYLEDAEIKIILKLARKKSLHSHRNYTMILLMYRHAFRVGELVKLKWQQISLKRGMISVKRLKNGIDGEHPLSAREIAALKKLRNKKTSDVYVFPGQYGTPMTERRFFEILKEFGKEADFDFPIHPHMLRHACITKLSNDGVPVRGIQLYAGHRDIKTTSRYMGYDPKQFIGYFND